MIYQSVLIGKANHFNNLVFACNHVSLVDGLVVKHSHSTKTVREKLSSVVANKYIDYIVIGPFLRWYGCFPASKHEKYEYGIEKAVKELKNGNSLLIFPEGGRPVNGIPRRPKHGIEVINKRTDQKILPIFIYRRPGRRIFKKFIIVYGEPFKDKNITSQGVMDRIYALKSKIPEHLL